MAKSDAHLKYTRNIGIMAVSYTHLTLPTN